MRSVGRSVPRREGRAKARGSARYVDDLRFPGLLHGRTIRTTDPGRRARRPSRLDFDPPASRSSTTATSPAATSSTLIEDDQPFLVEREIRHAEEPVLLLAHEDRETLARGRGAPRRSGPPSPSSTPSARRTCSRRSRSRRATSRAGSPRPTSSSRASTARGRQEHVYIEPNGVIAVPAPDGDHGLRLAAVPVLRAQGRWWRLLGPPPREGAGRADGDGRRVRRQGGLPVDHRRPRGAPRGEVRPAGQASSTTALEDMAATTKRHPSIVRHRTGVRARRPDHRDGDRGPARRRRLQHAEPGRALARVPARDGRLPLRRTSASTAGSSDDEHAAERRLPRASARRRRSSRSRPTWTASPRRSLSTPCACARGTCCGPGDRWPPGRCWAADASADGRAARGRATLALPPQAPGVGRHGPRASASRSSSTARASPARAR